MRCVLAGVLAAGIVGCAAEATRPACKYTAPAGLLSGVDYECGDVVVPENRDVLRGAEVALHYIRFFSPSNNPVEATLYLSGGPGDSGQSLLDAVTSVEIDQLRADSDFVVVAQRGTSRAEPALRCRADELPKDCSHRWGTAVDLSRYSTVDSADDVNDVRVALDFERVNLFGTSYGTRLALEVSRRHPEAVRALLLDGVVAPTGHWSTAAGRHADAAIRAVASACDVNPACKSAYGDVYAQFLAGIESLNAVPLPLGDSVPDLDGVGYASLVAAFMSGGAGSLVPFLVTSVAQRDAPAIANYVEEPGQEPGDISDVLFANIACGEFIFHAPTRAYDDASRGLPPALADAFRVEWEAFQGFCSDWNMRPLSAERKPVRVDVPALLMSGQLDTRTAPSEADGVAAALARARHIEYANTGHGTTLASQCGWNHAVAFLGHADATLLDPDCAGDVSLGLYTP